MVLTPGRKDQPTRERMADMVSDAASRCCGVGVVMLALILNCMRTGCAVDTRIN